MNSISFCQNIKVIKIGDQVWMKENMDVSTFRNGDVIPEAKTVEDLIKNWAKSSSINKLANKNFNNILRKYTGRDVPS